MLIPLEWLKEFVEFDLSDEALAEALTMAGLESTVESDGLLEVDITPNRGDCLSVLGVAREVAALTGAQVRLPRWEVQGKYPPDFKVLVDSPLCRRYAGRIIRGVRVGPSPDWMVKRLERCGLRSINNIVDVTNYVLLELGHPLHAFDLNTLREATIRVDIMAKPGSFRTLDGTERNIPPEALMIWDGQRPVAIAGIMGGEETEVKESTTDVFLESAYFEPISIRKTSKALGLRTESSIRFERGTDIEGLIIALDRATYLITSLAGGEVSERIDVYPYPKEQVVVTLREDFLKAHLGLDISLSEAEKILKGLGVTVKDRSDDKITVQVPSYRSDISIEVDLVEEVARIKGYHRVPSLLPETSIGAEGLRAEKKRTNRLRQLLMDEGYHEAISYSFIDPAHLKRLCLREDDPRMKVVKLENPLSTEQSIMRPFLLPCLIDNLTRNLTRGVRDVRLFEIGKVFLQIQDEGLPQEEVHLGGVLYTRKGQRLWQNPQDVFYQIKGVLEKLLQFMELGDYEFVPSEEPFLHPGKGASVYVNSQKIGFVGVLGPETKRAYDIESYREDVGVFEINLDVLLSMPVREKRFRQIPRFPYIQRDISLLLPVDRTVRELLIYIQKFPEENIEDAWIFDLYEGRGVPEGFRSVGISVIYRSMDRTLTEEEVEALHQKLLKGLMEHTGARLR